MEQKYEQEHELYSRALPYSLQGGSGWGEGGVGEWMFLQKVTTCDQGHQCGAAQGTSKCYRQALSRGSAGFSVEAIHAGLRDELDELSRGTAARGPGKRCGVSHQDLTPRTCELRE